MTQRLQHAYIVIHKADGRHASIVYTLEDAAREAIAGMWAGSLEDALEQEYLLHIYEAIRDPESDALADYDGEEISFSFEDGSLSVMSIPVKVAAVNALPELLERVKRLEADLKVAHGHEKTLRSLCREAGQFYSQGGIFPIDGEMSKRLQKAGGDWTVSLGSDWQPISSAPKDGTEIDLAYVSEYSGKIFRDPDCKWGQDSEGETGWMHYERHPEVSYEDTWQLVSYEPFAWRPVTLPARAALNQEGGQ